MPNYLIRAGLGGGFGGADNLFIDWYKDDDEAQNAAYIEAQDAYDSFDGMHGLRTIEQIQEEDELDEESAYDAYEQQREDWIDFEAVKVYKNKDGVWMSYLYNQPIDTEDFAVRVEEDDIDYSEN